MASPADFYQFLQDSDNQKLSCCMVACVSSEHPSNNEAIGRWIQNLAQELFAKHPNVRLYRLSWSNVVLLQDKCNEMESKISYLLAGLVHPNLTSCAVFSLLAESSLDRVSEIQKMELQAAKLDYWEVHAYSHYYRDGRKIQLNLSENHV